MRRARRDRTDIGVIWAHIILHGSLYAMWTFLYILAQANTHF